MMRRRKRENAMLKPNQFKRRLATGRNLAGIWLHSASPATIEALGDTGYDCLIVDNEHGPSTLEQTRAQLQASFPYDCGVCVRVPWNDAVYLKQLLDLGADTVMIPMVDDAEQAKAAVAACRYPPKGRRGVGPWRAMARGIPMADYMEFMAENLFVMVQIESERAVANVREIAAVDGVDMLIVGPNDLSGSLGIPQRFDDPVLTRAIDRVLAEAAKENVPVGTVPHGKWDPKALFARGFRLVAGSTEFSLMRRAAKAELESWGF
jgi:2-keto-3-deoxy-L-rhamnonate aldolase RhmA